MPAEDLERRRPVWNAMSTLFLDTEDDESALQWIAREVIEAGYTTEEAKAIFFDEIYPACIFNFHLVIGEWTPFDPDWLEQRILNNQNKPWKRWRLLQINRRVFEPQLDKILNYVREARKNDD